MHLLYSGRNGYSNVILFRENSGNLSIPNIAIRSHEICNGVQSTTEEAVVLQE
jgi:hypothetical protein